MNRQEQCCYFEEELLMHLLDEAHQDVSIQISNHLASCDSCKTVFNDLVEVEKAIRSWTVEELPEESWISMKTQLMQNVRRDPYLFQSKGIIGSVFNMFQSAWDYAVSSPIPAVFFIGTVIAFASESAIKFFRIQHMMPTASHVIGMLRKIL